MNILILPILIPTLSAIACLFLRNRIQAQKMVSVVGLLSVLLISCAILWKVHEGSILVLTVGEWAAPYGIVLVSDILSAIMLVVSNLIGCAVLIYAFDEISEGEQKRFFFPLYHFLMMGVNGSFLTGDLFNLYVWFEVMLMSSFVLLALGRKRDQLEGSIKYVSLNLFASILFLAGVGILYGKLGTLNMADIASKLGNLEDSSLINSSAILFLAAFGIKAGLFPFFFWLPASYHTPSVSISALFAGLLTKVGVYALMRTFTLFFVQDISFTHNLLLILAAATMVTGVLGAAAQFEMRRILSFHIISQIGYMILGLALFTPLALAGAIFYLAHHIIVKTNLFLISGAVIRYLGTDHLAKTGGLYRHAPWLAVLFFIPAFSLGGIPPLSGFWAKFSLVKAGLQEHELWVVAIALLVGILTLFSMTKLWAEVFWKRLPNQDKDKESEPKLGSVPRGMILPIAVLAIFTVIIGLCSQPFFVVAERAAEQLLDPTSYISAVLNGGNS
ncbi:MAG: Na+/H+ antiporter subunit D [Verrucomicrobiota bacterium]